LRISIYYASGHIEHGSLNEGQHRRVSAYKGFVNLDDVLRAEFLGEYKSDKSDEMPPPTTRERRGDNWGTETIVDGEPEPGKTLGLRKKGGEMLVMGEAPDPINRLD